MGGPLTAVLASVGDGVCGGEPVPSPVSRGVLVSVLLLAVPLGVTALLDSAHCIVSLTLCVSKSAGYSPVCSSPSVVVVSGAAGRVKSGAVVGSSWSPGVPRVVGPAPQLRGGGAQTLPLGHEWEPPLQHTASKATQVSPQVVRPSGHTGVPSLSRLGKQVPSFSQRQATGHAA